MIYLDVRIEPLDCDGRSMHDPLPASRKVIDGQSYLRATFRAREGQWYPSFARILVDGEALGLQAVLEGASGQMAETDTYTLEMPTTFKFIPVGLQ